MTNYNDGKWHGWNGGECPVHHETLVDVIMDNGHRETDKAREWDWNNDEEIYANVVAFRVVKEYREPREFWVNVYDNEMWWAAHASKSDADIAAASDRGGCIHVREVLE